MTSRMSVSMTLESVRTRSKTETRRRKESWTELHADDPLTLIEKGQGLRKGEKQVVVCNVLVTAVDLIPLSDPIDTAAEGLPEMTEDEFRRFWLKGHGYPADFDPAKVECRRIQWRYL